ncbi:MAG: CvpA family protein, partial [Anaerolineae bacterium]
MVPLDTFLWAFILVFGLMGALRGWSKEMLVLFSVIVALAMRLIFTEYVDFAKPLFDRPPREQFYLYSGLVILMTIAGYAGPAVSGRLARASARETLQDILLGFIVGAVNGYL